MTLPVARNIVVMLTN